MKHFGVSAGLGVCVIFGLIVLLAPNGPDKTLTSLLRLVSVLVVFVGLCGLILSLGWAAATVLRGANAHKAPNETRVIKEHTIDGRVPHAPQIVTMPGMWDAYPDSFRSEALGTVQDASYQRQLPQPARQNDVAMIDAAQDDDVFNLQGW